MNEAAQFYEEASPGLGVDFLKELEHSVSQIRRNPNSGSLIKFQVRRKVLRKYPYSLLYKLRGDQIRILAVMHHRRRPFYWRKRN
jgi:plasmid stabilization system protein ParE